MLIKKKLITMQSLVNVKFQNAVVAILHFFLVSSSFISATELTTQQLDPAHRVWIEICFV